MFSNGKFDVVLLGVAIYLWNSCRFVCVAEWGYVCSIPVMSLIVCALNVLFHSHVAYDFIFIILLQLKFKYCVQWENVELCIFKWCWEGYVESVFIYLHAGFLRCKDVN